MGYPVVVKHEAWEGRLHDLGEAEVKHGLALRLYSLVDGRSGAYWSHPNAVRRIQ